jgi:cation diffusion facilitator family transporter
MDHKHPDNRLKRGLRLTLLGMVANTLLAATKMVAGFVGHSHALVADGVESLSDLLSSVIVLRGLTVSAAPPDDDHPYGHGKAEPLAAAMVATMLLLASGWITIVAVQGFFTSDPGPQAWTLGVLVVILVVKEGLYRLVIREGIATENKALQGDAWHHRSDAITSLAAGVGITVAVLGGPGLAWADDAAALVGAGVIAWNGRRLLREPLKDLMDAAPDPAVVDRIAAIAEKVEGVVRVEKCLVRRMGYAQLVDMHIEVAPETPVVEAHRVAHEVKDLIRERRPSVADVLIHIEPAQPSAETQAANRELQS